MLAKLMSLKWTAQWLGIGPADQSADPAEGHTSRLTRSVGAAVVSIVRGQVSADGGRGDDSGWGSVGVDSPGLIQ
jgi:hypothetical protein